MQLLSVPVLSLAVKRNTVTRNRHVGPVEEFLVIWMKRKDNCKSSPEIRRNRAGVLMQQVTTCRVLKRNSGYDMYKADVLAEGHPHDSKAHFYLRNKEMGLVDSKSEARLCPNCNRYGTESCIEFLYPASDPGRRNALNKVDQLQSYFVSGGPFKYSL
jgi:hypothetical protein